MTSPPPCRTSSPPLANILIAPPVPFLPESAHGQLVVGVIGVYAGSVEDGARAMPPRTLAEPLADLMGPIPDIAMQSQLDPLWTAGADYFAGAMLDRLTDETIDTLLTQHAAGQAPVRELHRHHRGGAMARVPTAATACCPPRRCLRSQHHRPVPRPRRLRGTRRLGAGDPPGHGPVEHGRRLRQLHL